jgi:hypothetical protein
MSVKPPLLMMATAVVDEVVEEAAEVVEEVDEAAVAAEEAEVAEVVAGVRGLLVPLKVLIPKTLPSTCPLGFG